MSKKKILTVDSKLMEKLRKKKIKLEKKRVKKQEPPIVQVFPSVGGKPKVLMLSDVKGWGAWKRGEYIKKYLSDEFEFHMTDLKTFNNKGIPDIKWDIFFPLLHILTRYKKVQKLSKKVRTVTTVTSRLILKPSYGGNFNNKLKNFRKHTRNVDILIVNNLLVKPDAEKWFHGPVRYAPRGVDPDVFKFIRYPMEGRFTVYYVGKPVPEKGLSSIIKPICNRNIKDIRILINRRNYINAIPESKMVEKYNDSNIYIVASTIDGTPNPALEAASCGRPIISNYIGNMPEFIVHGENGFLVEKLEKDEYEEKLLYLKDNRKLAYEMGQKARETILREWTWEILLNKNQRNILREVLLKKEKKN